MFQFLDGSDGAAMTARPQGGERMTAGSDVRAATGVHIIRRVSA